MHLSKVTDCFSLVSLFFWSLFLVLSLQCYMTVLLVFLSTHQFEIKKQEMRSCNSPLNYICCGFHKFIVSPYQEVILFHSTTSPLPQCLLWVLLFSVIIVTNQKICPRLPLPGNTYVFFLVMSSVGCTPCCHLHRQQKRIVSRNVRELPNFTHIFKNKRSEGLGREARRQL